MRLFYICHLTCKTRMHSSRMRTARVLTVSLSMLCGGGGGVPGPGVPGPRGVYLVQGATWSSRGVPGPADGVPGPAGGCVPGLGGVPGLEGVPGPGGYLVGGCTWSGGVPGPGCVPGSRGVYLVWGRGCTWSWGVPCLGGCAPSLGGVPGPGGVVSGTPPMNRITHTCKNITLPQLRCAR